MDQESYTFLRIMSIAFLIASIIFTVSSAIGTSYKGNVIAYSLWVVFPAIVVYSLGILLGTENSRCYGGTWDKSTRKKWLKKNQIGERRVTLAIDYHRIADKCETILVFTLITFTFITLVNALSLEFYNHIQWNVSYFSPLNIISLILMVINVSILLFIRYETIIHN